MVTGTAEQWNRGVFLAIRTLMHFIAAFTFWYAIYYDFTFVRFPHAVTGYVQFGGKFKFLTFLDAIIQASYFTLCLLNDIFGTNEVSPRKSSSLRQLKDYVFGAFAWPLALNVGVSFWTLMAIDRELVLPKALDAYFPTWLNHVMHTNIVIFIVLELFTTFRQYPSRKSALTGLSIFMLAYLVWIHIIKHYAGVWVYPVLNVLEFGQRIVFFIVILLFCLGLYFVGEFLNNKIWASELRQIKSKRNK
ncbi:androgen-dependent TFPI-regulating protein-like isoform X1 [Bradysia coprophila]|uniref:androgen-dependent TFPI-regulating protein-like isoform X1 n=1 Tax=Bradysia coprophila TaxID=38358 RepID=UPI00187D736E|nr:androgen-dependent TFPI-regulating protein-like isoform X1 [Bradysia coprophila]